MASAEQTVGPYWVDYNGVDIRICGRFGKGLFRYGKDQEALADAHVKRLQRAYTKREKTIRDAAPELFEALQDLVARCDGEEGVRPDGSNIDTLRAHMALSRALGEG